MPLENKKIAWFSPNDHFGAPIREHLQKTNNVTVYSDVESLFTLTGNQIKVDPWLYKNYGSFDLLFFEWCSEFLMYASQLPKPPNTKVVCRLHSTELTQGKHKMVDWNFVDTVIFIAEHTKRKFMEDIPDCKATLLVIRVGIDLDKFYYKKPKETNKIGFSGNLCYVKNIPFLLEMFRVLYSHYPRFQLYIAGDIEEYRVESFFDHYIEQHPLPIFIEGRKDKDEMVNWYHDKELILVSSLYEGCCVTISEAMACGVPVISYNWDGIDELYPKWISIRNPQEILTKREEHTQYGYGDLKSISKMGREFVEQELSLKKMIENIDYVLES